MQEILRALADGARLLRAEAGRAVGAIMDGEATPAQIAAFLAAVRVRGETPDEIAGAAEAMRARAVRVRHSLPLVADTCGTGGDGRGTANISTMAALAVAAAGVPVAKHGNRAASSRCGSADVLEALGVRVERPREQVERALREYGFAFLYAPAFHPALRHAGPVRRELGFRTLFNLVGPLANPAGANVQMVGVPKPRLLDPVARALARFGVRGAVVHSAGMDELTPCGTTEARIVRGGRVVEARWTPATFGMRRARRRACGGIAAGEHGDRDGCSARAGRCGRGRRGDDGGGSAGAGGEGARVEGGRGAGAGGVEGRIGDAGSGARPMRRGRFGPWGGRYVPETLMANLEELERAYRQARRDPSFWREFRRWLREYAGRPTPLTFCPRWSARVGRARIYLKREDLLHTGAHKINNCIGQVLLARRLGKRRIIAETGAGQHGVATATVCARFGLECVVYMGAQDVRRQALNVYRMRLLGATVVPVESGTQTLKDAINEAIRDWVTNVRTTHYVIGSVVGPHPYPAMVRDFQSVIGREIRRQVRAAEGRLPDVVIACVGGGSNAMGAFHAFLRERSVRLIGVEAAGAGLGRGPHAASLARGRPGVLHGFRSYVLQDGDGQIAPAQSVAPGLDYAAVGPEHACLRDRGRVEYVTATDAQAVAAFRRLCREEGILPALEPAHALAHAEKLARRARRGTVLVVNLSGRGDKDVDIVRGWTDAEEGRPASPVHE
jgi:tryptophan synthase beta chain